ncbi:class I SAM-dependent methyltransferase [Gordonia sp. (in: high G+C Gram-positive bacteria)]|uniref:class I SAM-dependent methyltransferase n=1 Tax=Gordonia sp. (in: high G+C Gram-positive bacteria) TaxID=84139 RepID=UPI0016B0FD84|nr:class I SAM-dependent methyltransferase [Gordonia sp. (in: high G+C Gram-positive bacteria)]NLG45489.1 methyltransferase domain-containing protein [Gordonia sp. (in: high G+C Gram-positive bacteria)]
MKLAQIFESLVGPDLAIRITAYDGSSAGPENAEFGLNLKTPRGTTYMVTAPGDLGLARAYVAGDVELIGAHPGDPYGALQALAGDLKFRKPGPLALARVMRDIGMEHFKLIPPPPQESLPRWRRFAEGLRHSRERDAEAIHYHYDVSNRFYELVLGESMTYTCAVYPNSDATLEEAQENKYRLIFDKLKLKPGDRLLDIGCGWGGMVRYAARRGVHALGVTLSSEQAAWAQQAIVEQGLSEFAEVRFSDYRDVAESNFDAISSIGLTEHIGVANYPKYFGFMQERIKPGGLILNHSITRPDNRTRTKAGPFIDRYVFPDGELTGSGTIIAKMQNTSRLEVLHEENFRHHYAMTLRDWNANLVANWDEAVAEVGEGTARLWGLYMAGCRIGFERNMVQLHHVLATKLQLDATTNLPLRPWWEP